MWYRREGLQRREQADHRRLVELCLGGFIRSGTIDLSLDQLADHVGISKRMLVHHFGGRQAIEEEAMTRLEEKLRAQFSPDSFPARVSARTVVKALWEQTTAPESRGVLLLVMDLSRRAWNGSARARAFYEEQQRLWVELLMKFLPDRPAVEALLQSFQGAVLAYLINGNREQGKRALMRMLSERKRA